ncbi:MAG: arylsulfatase [Tannerella sp.]|nr:arylsulfatase [Tannerella sp.]
MILCSLSLNMIGGYAEEIENERTPNVIYIMADDLGIGDLGCYGQQFIKTPAIDRLAANGIRFAQHYSGCTVSAPSRCSLMTGKHTGHSFIRGNKGVLDDEGIHFDYPLASEELTVGEIMKRKDYVTACIGKWGMGGPGTEGHPNNQGFDCFFGYLGQANAHRYYPPFLFENQNKLNLNKKVYSHDLIMEKALNFIEENADKPFFLYLAPTIPHADIIVPPDMPNEYDGMFEEKPFPGGGYTAQPKPRATFAAMVSRLDQGVQQIMDLLETRGIVGNTIVIFTSDNGTHIEGGHDPFFFHSNGAFRGYKRELYEGGIRTPFIVHWPGKIKPGTVSYHVSAFWDFLPTMCELIDEQTPVDIDGISYLPALTGEGEQLEHDYFYWEFHEQGGKQAILKNNWKLIKLQVDDPEKATFELYNLDRDPSEQLNAAVQYPGIVNKLHLLMEKAHQPSILYPFEYEK